MSSRRHALPVGEVAAGHLRAALEDVPRGDAGGEAAQSSQPQPNSCTSGARISAASVVRPVTMMRAPPAVGLDHRACADVGVGGHDATGDLVVAALAVHVIEPGAGRAQGVEPRQQIVALDVRDLRAHAKSLVDRARGGRAAGGVEAARVDDDLDSRSPQATATSSSCARKVRAKPRRILGSILAQDHQREGSAEESPGASTSIGGPPVTIISRAAARRSPRKTRRKSRRAARRSCAALGSASPARRPALGNARMPSAASSDAQLRDLGVRRRRRPRPRAGERRCAPAVWPRARPGTPWRWHPPRQRRPPRAPRPAPRGAAARTPAAPKALAGQKTSRHAAPASGRRSHQDHRRDHADANLAELNRASPRSRCRPRRRSPTPEGMPVHRGR